MSHAFYDDIIQKSIKNAGEPAFLLIINYASKQHREKEAHTAPNYEQVPYCMREF